MSLKSSLQVCVCMHLIMYPWHSWPLGRFDPIQRAESSLHFRSVYYTDCQYKLDELQNCFDGIWSCFRSICNPSNTSLEMLTVLDFSNYWSFRGFHSKIIFCFSPSVKKKTLKYFTRFLMPSSPYDTRSGLFLGHSLVSNTLHRDNCEAENTVNLSSRYLTNVSINFDLNSSISPSSAEFASPVDDGHCEHSNACMTPHLYDEV